MKEMQEMMIKRANILLKEYPGCAANCSLLCSALLGVSLEQMG